MADPQISKRCSGCNSSVKNESHIFKL